jgi:hypothetical protein
MAMKRDDRPEMSEQDERIAGLYRSVSVEDPPSYLDARIAEAARLDPGSRAPRKRREWWILWRVPFAIAAVAVVSVSLVSLMIEHGGGDLTPAPREAPLRPPAADAVTVPSQPEIQPQRDQPTTAQSQTGASGDDKANAAAERRALARESPKSRERPAASPPAVVLAPEPPPAPPPTAMRDAATISERAPVRAEIGAATGARDLQKEQAQSMAAPAQAPAPLQSRAATAGLAAPAARAFKRADAVESETALASAVAKLVAELSSRPPAEWIERIAALRREGRHVDADALLEEFRRRYPDQPIPADLREK